MDYVGCLTQHLLANQCLVLAGLQWYSRQLVCQWHKAQMAERLTLHASLQLPSPDTIIIVQVDQW